MITYLLTGMLWITLQYTDQIPVTDKLWINLELGSGTVVECVTDQPVQYYPATRVIQIDDCYSETFPLDTTSFQCSINAPVIYDPVGRVIRINGCLLETIFADGFES